MIVFDTEVFKHNWMFIASDPINKKWYEIVDDVDELQKFYEQHKYEIWASFNGKNYDRYIVQGLLTGHDPYKISKYIIDGNLGFNYSSDFNMKPLYIYDIYNNLNHGLKYYEGSFGDDIRETTVDFNIDRPLTPEEIDEVLFYCGHDVHETTKLLFEALDSFYAQLGLCKLSRPQYLSKTQTQLAALILKAEPINPCGTFLIDTPDTLKLSKYDEVREWYLKSENHDYEKSLTIKVAGIDFFFGWGGVHASRDKYHYKGNILVADVASLYPSLMIEYELLSSAVKRPELYKELRDKRLEYKKEHNPLQLPLKLVLNKTYGGMKTEHCDLLDPRQANRVCIYGQLLLLDLVEHLEPYINLIQANTDGIFFSYDDDNLSKINDIMTEWQGRTRLLLEVSEATEIWQKDVNNYILKLKDGTLKSKGAYVKKLTSLDYTDYPIINKALTEALVNGVPVDVTINNATELIDFQMICKLTSGKSDALYYGDKQLNEKCIRIFAGDSNCLGVNKRNTEKQKLQKFPNTPDHCIIDNSDIHGKPIPANLDRQFYIDLAKKRFEEFI